MFDDGYISLEHIAALAGLSQKFIRDQVKAGKIPYLMVNGRMKFQENHVRGALEQLEQTTAGQGKHVLTGELQ